MRYRSTIWSVLSSTAMQYNKQLLLRKLDLFVLSLSRHQIRRNSLVLLSYSLSKLQTFNAVVALFCLLALVHFFRIFCNLKEYLSLTAP